MNNIEQTTQEKNTKRVILLSSTFIVLFVTFTTAYMLINTEIMEFKNHIKIFRSTLLSREKNNIKATVKNFINDIKYEENLRSEEIEKRVKNQTQITYQLLISKKNLDIEKTIDLLKKLSGSELNFFVIKNDGTLLFHNSINLPNGTNIFDLKDVNGKAFVKDILQNNGLIEYYWFAPKSNRVSKKITYSIKLKNLDITIGCGEFLETEHSLNSKILNKMEEENFSKNDFIFIYEIMSLSSSKNYSKLILEKNIKTSDKELIAVEEILKNSGYKGDIFYEYDNKLTYSAFLFDEKTFISAGVDLKSIEKIIQSETNKSHMNLENKINSLVINVVVVLIIFFILSYFMVKHLENMFKNYRLTIENSQQLLIQKSKMASMGEMIGNIAHQWRQPLAQLSGIFLDIETAHTHKELNQKYLEVRTNEANDLLEYMSKTIDDFKEFYKPNAKEECFNLRKTIQNTLKIVDSSLKFYHINATLDVDDSLHVKGLPNEFSQVILNIITNVKDIVSKERNPNPNIAIYSELSNNKISLHVEDNCGGIKKENFEKIFEPYFTTKYKYGTGIGLYMSKIIIENKMSGKIYATNIHNQGAIFTIELPRCYKK